MAIYSLVALPHTPPPARGQKVTWQRAVGLDTLSMMKQGDVSRSSSSRRFSRAFR